MTKKIYVFVFLICGYFGSSFANKWTVVNFSSETKNIKGKKLIKGSVFWPRQERKWPKFQYDTVYFDESTEKFYNKNGELLYDVDYGLNFYIHLNEKDIRENRLFRNDCFLEIMGFYEAEFRNFSVKKVPNWGLAPILKELKDNVDNNNSPDGYSMPDASLKKYPGQNALCGSRFRIFTIKDLKTKIESANFRPVSKGKFELIDGYKIKEDEGWRAALEKTDIAYLQETNPGAVFQIASTFNALEGGMGRNPNDYGEYLEKMQKTPTQGENAALATMGATIIRKYCLKPIKLLQKLCDQNKVVMNTLPGKSGLVFKINNNLTQDDINDIAIGLHSDVVVTSGYYGCYSKVFTERKDFEFSKENFFAKKRIDFLEKRGIVAKDREPFFISNKRIDLSDPTKLIRIDQVFTAALKQKDSKNVYFSEANAKIILEAAYKGTLYAAAYRVLEKKNNAPQKVFLTLVGAGAFGNDIAWIVEILNKQWLSDIIHKFGLEVYLVIYPSTRKSRAIDVKDLKSLRNLEKKIQKNLKSTSCFNDFVYALDSIKK